MAGKSFLRQVSGAISEILGIQTSAGAGNAGDIPALDSTGRLDISMMPVGVTPEVVLAVASETLVAGNFVNLWNDTGTLKVRKADASAAGKPANGFVLAGFSTSATATVYLTSNVNTQLSALTPGTDYYLDPAVPGGVTATAPTGVGKVSQLIGRSTSATSLVFDPMYPIVLAA